MNLPAYLNDEKINAFISQALKEDIGDGDHTSLASIPPDVESKARLLIKDSGIIAGLDLAVRIFKFFDPELEIDLLIEDGDRVKKGDIGLIVHGKSRSILSTERLVLNCMQRMSGIATYTNYLQGMINQYNTRLLDTRKTTPNFRSMEKWAVLIGGGTNHRYGLYDMILLKDNHIDYAGGIEPAITRCQTYLEENNLDLGIEIETRNLEEVAEVIATGGVQRIMLDNMDTQTMTKAIKLIDGKFETEASGGITEDTIQSVAATGVDFISVGALTHSIKSLDISLKAFTD